MKKWSFILLLLVLLPSLSPAKDGVNETLSELKTIGERWRAYSPCQKLFVLGYSAYIDGRFKSAKECFEACDGKYPLLQPYIDSFLKKIDAGGEKFSYLDRSRENADEIAYLEREISSAKATDDERPALSFDLAKAYFKGRQYASAADLFREVAEYPSLRLSSLEYLATSLARQEKYDEAIEINQQIIDENERNAGTRAKALYKIGFLYLDGGDYARAEQAFSRLQKQSRGYQQGQVEWYLAWCAYKTGKFGLAANRFSLLEKKGGKDWAKRATYWKAASLAKMGQGEEAKDIFEKLYDNGKISYYSISAGKRLGVKKITLPSDLAEAEDIEPEVEFGSGDDRELLAAARELDHLGLSDLVVEELEGLIRSKKRQLNWEDVRRLAVKNNGWYLIYPRVSYPRAYEKYVTEVARKTGVDPNFAWAIMREESTFRPKVVSKSGAIGLMQLMPFTAKRMTVYPYNVESLFLPKFNIDAGVRYLSFLLKRYGGNFYLAAAGYNAGEEAVDRWAADGLPKEIERTEEFVEEIPYKETNDYVKKVMKSYWVYSSAADRS